MTKKELIDKACKWLMGNVADYVYRYEDIDYDEMVKDFRKDMEETKNNNDMIEENITIDVVVKETTKDISDKVIDTLMSGLMVGKSFNLPEGYQFKDENGNVINATKIVLEKKKKEYPKTYEECCNVLEYIPLAEDVIGYKWDILQSLQTLLICRDAYWKIAGDEMGLGKPWEPDYDSGVDKFGIVCYDNTIQNTDASSHLERHLNKILDFPTKEMRDAFKENLKDLIEQCKELL